MPRQRITKSMTPMMKKEVPNKTPNDERRTYQNQLHHDKSERSNIGNENHQLE
ncbi:24537_t:CDS:2 [Gigaspora margarita]|uniref:24537_t:CDS:1 n=1 Tax=Gigaspora margarita TaxID=4874 RepID=A0ABN7UGB4_GIGMA|nr:24537_t:CDS:2 [Gigaspora margarita]